MIAIYLQSTAGDKLELHSRHAEGEVGVGAAADCGIRITGGVFQHHCKLLVRAAGCFVIDICGETTVNGRPINGPRALYRDDVVRVGTHTMFVEYVPGPPDPIAARLLEEILAGDLPSREVYADWLEEHGDPRRAELLRIQDRLLDLSPDDPQQEPLARRLRELATVIELDWRILVARCPVERCEDRCSMDWGRLATTTAPLQRRCTECKNLVAYCESLTDRHHGIRRVAIDATVRRVPGDLDTRP